MNWYKKSQNQNQFTLQDVQVKETKNASGQTLIHFIIPNVGNVDMNEWKGVYILDDMGVEEPYRRMGIGTLLLQAAKNYANMKGKRIQLTPEPYEPEQMSYEDLSSYYSKSGFNPTGEGELHEYNPQTQ